MLKAAVPLLKAWQTCAGNEQPPACAAGRFGRLLVRAVLHRRPDPELLGALPDSLGEHSSPGWRVHLLSCHPICCAHIAAPPEALTWMLQRGRGDSMAMRMRSSTFVAHKCGLPSSANRHRSAFCTAIPRPSYLVRCSHAAVPPMASPHTVEHEQVLPRWAGDNKESAYPAQSVKPTCSTMASVRWASLPEQLR